MNAYILAAIDSSYITYRYIGSQVPTVTGVGAQSTLGGHQIFVRKICIKNQQNARILHDSCPKVYQNTQIFMIFARKIYKIP